MTRLELIANWLDEIDGIVCVQHHGDQGIMYSDSFETSHREFNVLVTEPAPGRIALTAVFASIKAADQNPTLREEMLKLNLKSANASFGEGTDSFYILTDFLVAGNRNEDQPQLVSAVMAVREMMGRATHLLAE